MSDPKVPWLADPKSHEVRCKKCDRLRDSALVGRDGVCFTCVKEGIDEMVVEAKGAQIREGAEGQVVARGGAGEGGIQPLTAPDAKVIYHGSMGSPFPPRQVVHVESGFERVSLPLADEGRWHGATLIKDEPPSPTRPPVPAAPPVMPLRSEVAELPERCVPSDPMTRLVYYTDLLKRYRCMHEEADADMKLLEARRAFAAKKVQEVSDKIRSTLEEAGLERGKP